ncbi:MAG: hypothetical protein KGL59_10820 [Acidobacteriota bacterium]|nr:hypothetical protein [Acidobacteriota bacterium]
MRLFKWMMTASMAMLLFAGVAAAQQKPAQEANRVVPLKVNIVLSEYDGTKKVSSLPYTIDVNAVTAGGTQWTHLRLGVRVPVQTGAGSQFQYVDVGTNIDSSARALGDGSYQLDITTERSSVSLQGSGKEMQDVHVSNLQPIIRTFRVSNSIILRDGQSDESTVAADPVSGHVMRISVTLHVVK